MSKNVLSKGANAAWLHELTLLLHNAVVVRLVIAAGASVVLSVVGRDAVHGTKVWRPSQLIA